MKKTVLALFCLASVAFAEDPWPKSVGEIRFELVSTSTLPPALRQTLAVWDEFIQGGSMLPGTFKICRFDLNDGDEAIIVQSHQSYSGGPISLIFAWQGERFVEIGSLQGSAYFATGVNSSREIVSEARAGAGAYFRTHQRYERGRFRPVRVAEYLRLDGERGSFVREVFPAAPKP